MFWKRSTGAQPDFRPATLALALAACALALNVSAQSPALLQPPAHPSTDVNGPTVTPKSPVPPPRKFRAVDADNHNILLNKPGMITLLIGTNEDSQDGARAAGKAMYPFQGRPDFQLIVVVDLRGSIASWVPSVVLSRMRSSLDSEAIELKPYYLKNGNKNNPRSTCYVVPDFKGTVCPQLNWAEDADDLRGILFGADGREIKRWDKLDDMTMLQTEVHAALQALVDINQTKAAAAAKPQGSKLTQPPTPPPPLPPAPAKSK